MSQYLHSQKGPLWGAVKHMDPTWPKPRTSPSMRDFFMVQVAYDVEISPQHPPKAVVEEVAGRDMSWWKKLSEIFLEFI